MCGDNWIWSANLNISMVLTTIYFLNEDDALAFKLRFATESIHSSQT